MPDIATTYRRATAADLAPLHAIVESAYRGESARAGWTHEADMLDGQRIEASTLAAILADPNEILIVAEIGGAIAGTVQVSGRGDGIGYLGLLSVDPGRQANGLGKGLMASAERAAQSGFGATTMELTVIAQRAELIAYYERRGYVRTGERRPFPIPMTPPFELVVLRKPLSTP